MVVTSRLCAKAQPETTYRVCLDHAAPFVGRAAASAACVCVQPQVTTKALVQARMACTGGIAFVSRTYVAGDIGQAADDAINNADGIGQAEARLEGNHQHWRCPPLAGQLSQPPGDLCGAVLRSRSTTRQYGGSK